MRERGKLLAVVAADIGQQVEGAHGLGTGHPRDAVQQGVCEVPLDLQLLYSLRHPAWVGQRHGREGEVCGVLGDGRGAGSNLRLQLGDGLADAQRGAAVADAVPSHAVGLAVRRRRCVCVSSR